MGGNMLRIAKSLLTIIAVAAIATGATGAYYSDMETSAGNSFTSGTMNLKIDGQDGTAVTTKYTLTNWKPGDDKMVGQVKVKNDGTIDGKYWIEIANVVNNENGCGTPETVAGDTCSTPGDSGELGSKIRGYFQENVSPWAHLNPSFSSIDSAAGVALVPADGGVLTAGEEVPVVLYAKWLSTATDNMAQGDSVSFDLIFHLEQV
jgi:predicted ribosomally synthesized peptide with SipW-like signal peptide